MQDIKCTAGIVSGPLPSLCSRTPRRRRYRSTWFGIPCAGRSPSTTTTARAHLEKWVLRLKPVCSSRRLELYIDVLELLGARRELFDAAAASCNGTVRPGWTIMDHLRGLPESRPRFMAYAGWCTAMVSCDPPCSMANAAKLRQLRVHNPLWTM